MRRNMVSEAEIEKLIIAKISPAMIAVMRADAMIPACRDYTARDRDKMLALVGHTLDVLDARIAGRKKRVRLVH
jgi:hypothetical protein